MPRTLADIGEFGFIDKIARTAFCSKRVIKGIGDDTAVLPLSSRKYLLFTTDMMAEGVHFTRRAAPQAIGHKALACNISDIAAMGGVPTYAVVSIGLPPQLAVGYAGKIYEGINRLAKEFSVSVVGDDTIRSNKIVINIALLGEVEKKYLTLRSGAKVGDWIFVTGALGRSLATGKHLKFIPRLKEARFLAGRFKPSAIVDISDGLAGDLGHILRASKVGARIFEKEIPRTKGATLTQALYDGEDFELLFTLSLVKAQSLIAWQAARRGWFFYPIGRITAGNRLELVKEGGRVVLLKTEGFKHF